MVMQGGHDGSSRGMPDYALGFDDWSQCAGTICRRTTVARPGDMAELGARVGMDGWTVAAISAPNCWMSGLGGQMINCYLGLCLPPVACSWADMVIDHWSQSLKADLVKFGEPVVKLDPY